MKGYHTSNGYMGYVDGKAATAGNGGQNNYSRPAAAADAEGFMNIPDGIDDELPFS